MHFRRETAFHLLIFIWLLIGNLKRSSGQLLPGLVFPGDGEAAVRLAYCNILNRCPDPSGFQHFSNKVRLLGGQIHEIIRDLAMSPEFEQKHIRGNINAIENIYLKILGRAPDMGGRATWNEILKTKGYQYVVNELLNSQEYRHKFGTNSVPGSGMCNGC